MTTEAGTGGEAFLNGQPFDPEGMLPEPWACEGCGKPVYVGALGKGFDSAGPINQGVFEEVALPEDARVRGQRWAVGKHSCPMKGWRRTDSRLGWIREGASFESSSSVSVSSKEPPNQTWEGN